MTETTDRADEGINPHDPAQRDRLVGEMYRRLSTARNSWGHPLVGADELAALGSLRAALTDAERELATALAEARRYNNLYRGALTPAKWGTPPVQPNA